ncbi:hypothetical protein F5146DRAFT_1129184 [Armillaria mellea]|nr:hypothetical protein F5146DRAFT_1129184 [Armillaria mellea]
MLTSTTPSTIPSNNEYDMDTDSAIDHSSVPPFHSPLFERDMLSDIPLRETSISDEAKVPPGFYDYSNTQQSNDNVPPGFYDYSNTQQSNDNAPPGSYDYSSTQQSNHQLLEYSGSGSAQDNNSTSDDTAFGMNTTQTPVQWVQNKRRMGAIVEEAFLDPNRVTGDKHLSSTFLYITDEDVTASGAPTMAKTIPCIKKAITRDLVPILIGYLILAVGHTTAGAVEAQILIDHFMAYATEDIRKALLNIPASSFYCLWFPISHFMIYSATKLLLTSHQHHNGQAISPAQMGMVEATHAIFVVVDPPCTDEGGGPYTYVSAIILARILVQWAHHNGVSEDTLAIKNITYQLVDSDVASSVIAILLVTLKHGTLLNLPLESTLGVGVHIKKYHKKNAANDNNADLDNDGDFDIMATSLSHALSIGT